MKTLKLLQRNLLYILLCPVIAGGCNMTSETEEIVEVTSEIVEVKADYSRMPSYCNPKSYKILKTPKGYTVQLSGGTITGDYYKTPEQAQKAINKRAARSKQRWIDSGGIDY